MPLSAGDTATVNPTGTNTTLANDVNGNSSSMADQLSIMVQRIYQEIHLTVLF